MKPTPEDRFWAKVDVSLFCWEWTASKFRTGYGQFSMGARNLLAHRFAYELLVGPVPEGLELDHLCRNRACVNPDHLEPVTHRENARRGLSPVAHNSDKTHCPTGHPYAPPNLYIDRTGRRHCIACRREHQRVFWARRRTESA